MPLLYALFVMRYALARFAHATLAADVAPNQALQLLQQGLAHHQAGRLNDAEMVYRRVLAEQPDNPDALHLLGVLATQVGRAEAAVPLLRRAVQVLPQMAPF